MSSLPTINNENHNNNTITVNINAPAAANTGHNSPSFSLADPEYTRCLRGLVAAQQELLSYYERRATG